MNLVQICYFETILITIIAHQWQHFLRKYSITFNIIIGILLEMNEQYVTRIYINNDEESQTKVSSSYKWCETMKSESRTYKLWWRKVDFKINDQMLWFAYQAGMHLSLLIMEQITLH